MERPVPSERTKLRQLNKMHRYFLSDDRYAVVFAHRNGSLLPFNRHLRGNVIDMLTIAGDDVIQCTCECKLCTFVYAVDAAHTAALLEPVRAYGRARNRLLMVPFTTVYDYMG